MLNFACTAKARKRTVTLTRPSRDDPLQVEPDDDKKTDELPFQFNIVGGYEKGFGIFISKVEPGSKVNDIVSIFDLHSPLHYYLIFLSL